MFSDELIVLIRERLDYESVFGEFVELKGHGRERSAFCVFHENTHTPAMSINVDDGLYFCHQPECGAKGDVFSFYMRVRSLTFKEAVAELARRVGVEAPDPSVYDVGPRAQQPIMPPEEQEALIQRYVPPNGDSPGAALVLTSNTVPAPEKPPAPVSGPEAGIDERVVKAAHARLLNSEERLTYLQQRRGLSRETITKYELGFDGQRYQIPVRDQVGLCVNIRQYRPDAKRSHEKMISWRVGYGEARLYPVHALTDAEPIYLMEGEMDCLLARQHGLNALTTTGGAGAWRGLEWNELFRNRNLIICYDNDDAGRAGSSRIAIELIEIAKSIKVVTIPLTEPPGADFTNFIVDNGHTIADFRELVGATPIFQRGMESATSIRMQQEPIELHLSQASNHEYYNTPIRMNVVVSGKHSAPYLVPREVRAGNCGLPALKMCQRCPVAKAAGSITKRMEFESNDVLQFIDINDQQLQRAVKAKVGVPVKCGFVELETLEAMNVEMLQVIPEIDRKTTKGSEYVTRQAYYIGDKHDITANNSYLVTGITVPEPKKQFATHLLHTAIAAQSNIDAFRLTPAAVDRLKSFRPDFDGVEGLWVKLGAIYDDMERVTRIYQRRDLMLATDLTYHSMLTFVFQGDPLVRGWIETLFIGDSRTGKSTVVQRMLDHYQAGEFASGENTSFAGLVGGLHQVGTAWALQWGRIPLNDRRLIVIDEAGNLPTDQIARLSSMRSSGIAEIMKIHTEKTNARTRQLWISNPRGNRPLSSYSQGVLAVKELIGAPEDIARFDLVVSAASGDVSLAVVNAPREHEAPDTFTRELCHQRVMWAWSRESKHIEFTADATQTVLRIASQHGQQYRYATQIPLVEPNEQRIKLARVATATAALFFSTDDSGEQVIVKSEHVEFAAQFLESLYAKPSMSFDEYAQQATRRYKLESVDEVTRILTRSASTIPGMMEQEQMNVRDLEELLAPSDKSELRVWISALRHAGFLQRIGVSYYVKTPAAIIWLRERMNGQTSLEEMTTGTSAVRAPAMAHLNDGNEVPDAPGW